MFLTVSGQGIMQKIWY